MALFTCLIAAHKSLAPLTELSPQNVELSNVPRFHVDALVTRDVFIVAVFAERASGGPPEVALVAIHWSCYLRWRLRRGRFRCRRLF